jgi:hypothetical protein
MAGGTVTGRVLWSGRGLLRWSIERYLGKRDFAVWRCDGAGPSLRSRTPHGIVTDLRPEGDGL